MTCVRIGLNHVSEDYFRTFGIETLAGRVFARSDGSGALEVAVLNETAAKMLAQAYLAGRSPIGESIELEDSRVHQVVGVVGDHKHLSVREPAPPYAFVPLWQPTDPSSRLTQLDELWGEPSDPATLRC